MTAPVDKRSIQTILYDEVVKASKVYTEEEQVNQIVNRRPREAHDEKVSAFLKKGKRHYNGRQKASFDEAAVVSKAKGTLADIEYLVTKLRQLGVESLRNITTREREQIDQDYQFFKNSIKTLAAQTKFQNLDVMLAEPESLQFFVESPTLKLLGYDQFRLKEGLKDPEFWEDFHEDDETFFHNIKSDKNAAKSLNQLDDALSSINTLNTALNTVETRMMDQVRSIEIGTEDTNPLKERFAYEDTAKRAVEAISSKTEIALLTQTAGPLTGLSLL